MRETTQERSGAMKVTICGPNLIDQSKGQFHVHAAGCGHLKRGAVRESAYRDGWTIEAATKREAVEAVYEDQIEEGADYGSCRSDLYFMACCDGLPEGDDDGQEA